MKEKIIAALLLLLPPSAHTFCHVTYQECTNGLFNPEKCACDCIPPYCPDSTGDCLLPAGGYCGGNPWQSCTMGVDCPWWTNTYDRCDTGSSVPAGTFNIYPSLDYCCNANFPYSTVCNPVTAGPTVRPSTSSPTLKAENETIPIKLSLFGLPKNVLDVPGTEDAITDELKRLVTNVSNEIDGFKITHESENYEPDHRVLDGNNRTGPGRSLQDDAEDYSTVPTQTVHLYYDVTVTKNSNEQFAPSLIRAVRYQHREILQQLQEFNDQGGYSHATNFDLCTTSSNSDSRNNLEFESCSQDHQSVLINFRATGLPPDLVQDTLVSDLRSEYTEILSKMDGLGLIDMELDKFAKDGNSTNVFFKINFVRDDRNNWDDIIEMRLQNDAVMLSKLGFLNQEGQATKWCIDDLGSIEPCLVVKAEPYVMPVWIIITIAIAAGVLLCCILISVCICARQNAHSEDDAKDNLQTYFDGPRKWRGTRHESHREKVAPSSGRANRMRRHGHGDERRTRHRHGRTRSHSHRRRRHAPPKSSRQHHPQITLHPSQCYPPPPKQELHRIEGPVYCNDEEMNRPKMKKLPPS